MTFATKVPYLTFCDKMDREGGNKMKTNTNTKTNTKTMTKTKTPRE